MWAASTALTRADHLPACTCGCARTHVHTHMSACTHAYTHLGSSIVGATAAGLQEVAVPHDIRQPKVGDLDVHARIQQQVLRLQVAVHHLRFRQHMNDEMGCGQS